MKQTPSGTDGWDSYAPFYDWENAQTVARRDIAFWQRLAFACGNDGPVLELGCGTGRVALPVVKAGATLVGVDFSAPMLARARRRLIRARLTRPRASGSRRHPPPAVPIAKRLRPGDGAVRHPAVAHQRARSPGDAEVSRPRAQARRSLRLDLVPDLPRWSEYRRRTSLKGRRDARTTVTLVESVRQDRRRKLTIFDQEYVERRGRARTIHRFALTFRTLSVPQVARRLERAGFAVQSILGDYQGGPWDARADVWVIIARKRTS